MDNTHLRMIANPHRLVKTTNVTTRKDTGFKTNLQKIISTEYKDIYIHSDMHEKIHTHITDLMKEYICEIVAAETIDTIISKTLREIHIQHIQHIQDIT